MTHATKAGTRVLVNTSPEPFSNWAVSIGEDIAVIAGLWTALNHPVLFLIGLAAFILLLVWFLPKLWRGIKGLFRRIGRLFDKDTGNDARDASVKPATTDTEASTKSAAPPDQSDG